MIIEGVVVHGDHLGRTLWFPTANIPVDPGTCDAVTSLCTVNYNGQHYPAVGTYLPHKWVYEVHLLDFDGDLYGQSLIVKIGDTLRPNQKFDSLTALKEQITQDVIRARSLFVRP